MHSISSVLFKCLVREYYRRNAGFFAFILIVAFSFLRGTEHIAIGKFIVRDLWMILLFFMIQMAYFIKTFLFVARHLKRPENSVLHHLTIVSKKDLYSSFLNAALLLLLPVLLYSGFLVVLAFDTGFMMHIPVLFLCEIILILCGVLILITKTKLLPVEQKNTRRERLFNRHFIRKPYLFFIEHLFRNEFVLLILTKIYTCLLLIGTILFYRSDTYDFRVLATGALLAFIGNIMLVHRYIWFEHTSIKLTKNLPTDTYNRFLTHLLIISLLHIPEAALLLRYYLPDISFGEIMVLFIFGISIALLAGSYTLKKMTPVEALLLSLFWFIIFNTILILFSMPIILLSGIYVLISFVLFCRNYYAFEYFEEKT